MIRREDGNDWLLIPQTEHARLAADIAERWGNAQAGFARCAEELVSAVRHHDDGWLEWEQAPHIDPTNGTPRSFLEMPMTEATEIWNRSIDVCSRDTSWYLAALRTAQIFGSMRPLDAVFHEILRMKPRFRTEELTQRLQSLELQRRVSRSAIHLALHWLEKEGWIFKLAGTELDAEYERLFPSRPPSPLGGMAVSKHFCWLAEQARESRAERTDELSAVNEFIQRQHDLQRSWRRAVAASQLSTDAVNRRIEEGFRTVQFFDRLSLWICCAPRTEPLQLEYPGSGCVEFVPRHDWTFTVKPFPFPLDPVLHADKPMTVEVSAKRIAARRYVDDADLQSALADAAAERLTWTFTLW